MGLVLPPIEAYPVQHLPIVKAYADKIGLVEVINQLVPMEMAIVVPYSSFGLSAINTIGY
jgi:hypothetical protein